MNFEFEVKRVFNDIGKKLYVCYNKNNMVSLYCPNRDNPEFYVDLHERISEVGLENLITWGHYNLSLDCTLDCHNCELINVPRP